MIFVNDQANAWLFHNKSAKFIIIFTEISKIMPVSKYAITESILISSQCTLTQKYCIINSASDKIHYYLSKYKFSSHMIFYKCMIFYIIMLLFHQKSAKIVINYRNKLLGSNVETKNWSLVIGKSQNAKKACVHEWLYFSPERIMWLYSCHFG